MRKDRIGLFLGLSVLSLTLLAGCSSSDTSTDTAPALTDYWANQEFDTTLKGNDFVVVAENSGMQLQLNPNSGVVRWYDTATGAYQDTNMTHSEGMGNLSARQRSDVLVTYFSGTKRNNKLYDTVSTFDSYSMCVELDQLCYQKLDNGIRIVYMMGNNDFTYKNFPIRISDERMNEFVIQYLDAGQLNVLKNSYYTQMSNGTWQRKFNTNDQNKIGNLALKEVKNLFYEVGQYTEEHLLEDLEAEGVAQEDYPSNLFISVPVEYTLEDGDLVVSVDTKMIETGADNPINKLELIPYFLTSAADKDVEEGYMFIPDGSGALIYLDSDKVKEYHFASAFYNGDQLVNATTYQQKKEVMMPVFGMKTSDSTIFGIIEDGAEVAFMDAYVSGQDNAEPFCKLKLSFDIQTQQAVSTGASNSAGEFTLYKATNDVYDDLIRVRYKWLGEDADYVDMANCYADYLVERGLSSEAAEDDAPFYVELMGSTDKTQFMLGIPYDGKQTLTSFKQAQEILGDLNGAGVKNIKLLYSGMVNGGMNQRSLDKGISFASGLGGSSDWNSLKSYADSIGAQIFPNLQLQTAYTRKKLSNEAVAWNVINERAQVYSFDPVERKVETEDENDYPLYIINPNYIEKYLEKVKSSYQKKIGLTTMATSDLFTFIPTNYQEKQVSPSTGRQIMDGAVAQLTDGMTIMLSNPASDAYAYSNYLTDIPTEDSGMRIFDASIPFMEMVLNGYKTYSSESLNLESTDVDANFMHVLEGGSAPKFSLMYNDSSLLSQTEQENYFAVDYSYWKDRIVKYYNDYQTFFNATKDAVITEHELYDRNEFLRIVTYSNGAKVYFNYSDVDETIDGVSVPALSYVIQ